MFVMAFAKAVKFAVLVPAGTCTEGGAVNAVGALFVRVTVAPPVGAAWDRVTVQGVAVEAPMVTLPQVSPLTDMPAAMEITQFLLTPPKLAVTVEP